ncbi:MAG: type II/IV secretion system ATPase subunit [ANME-2 cluster archaeon]|nr:type II/IV secretion system ATPase subunit [ANME-2 cluster archaeon]
MMRTDRSNGNSIFKLLSKKKADKADNSLCTYKIRLTDSQKSLMIDCRGCTTGNSGLDDRVCRKNIFQIMIREPMVDRLVLSHLYDRDYEGASLRKLYILAGFIDNLGVFADAYVPAACGNCLSERQEFISAVLETGSHDPIEAYITLIAKVDSGAACHNGEPEQGHVCTNDYIQMLASMSECAGGLGECMDANLSPGEYYTRTIKPYTRPKFSTSRIYTEPPDNAVFLEGYDVKRSGGRAMEISLYSLSDRPESLYFLIPPEYNLRPEELGLLESVRSRLMRHRPNDLNFADPVNSREYFRRRSQQILSEEAGLKDIRLKPDQITVFADILAKYTTGLGILEDVLSDARVTDIYVNAPVDTNPVHVVIEGEECSSNIYLSQDDVDTMISRFRALSGRPFGEANPILDMDLAEYRTRVSCIGNPLSSGGLAYAFRKHAQTPWTLPKLINEGSMTPLAAGLLSFLVDGHSSILIAGGVGAGKTSLLSALLLEVPQKYRILTIEDTPELPLRDLQRLGWKVQGMNTRSAIAGSESEIAPDTALRAALRLGNSTLAIGEVRGPEARMLYEAMQVGTAGNSVLGTIHGASTQTVYERIVGALGVPEQSFRATDAVVVCSNIRISGSMRKKKRLVQVSEVTSGNWDGTSTFFNELMMFDAGNDRIEPTDLLDMGQSELIGRIADRWGVSIDEVLLNIKMRAQIKGMIAEAGRTRPELVEADRVGQANNMFWLLMNELQDEDGGVDLGEVYSRWCGWYEGIVQG